MENKFLQNNFQKKSCNTKKKLPKNLEKINSCRKNFHKNWKKNFEKNFKKKTSKEKKLTEKETSRKN